jgi:dienelactone hydrolase
MEPHRRNREDAVAIVVEPKTYEGPGGPFAGAMAFDDAWTGPRPGLLVIHTAHGPRPLEENGARSLVERGYAALVVDLYGAAVRPTNLDDALTEAGKLTAASQLLLDRMSAALGALRADPHVDPTRVAAMGYCLGGKAVLDLARSGADVAGVISLHGGYHRPSFPNADPIGAKVLVLHGWDDHYSPPELLVALAEELTAAGADWRICAYGRTGHSFLQNPDTYRRSWAEITAFVAELFPQ